MKALGAITQHPEYKSLLDDAGGRLEDVLDDPNMLAALKTALKSHVPKHVADHYGVSPSSVKDFADELDNHHRMSHPDFSYDHYKNADFDEALLAETPLTDLQGIVGGSFPRVKRLGRYPSWFDESSKSLGLGGLEEPTSFSGALANRIDGASEVMSDRGQSAFDHLMDFGGPDDYLSARDSLKKGIADTFKQRNTSLLKRSAVQRNIDRYRALKDEVQGVRDQFPGEEADVGLPSREELGFQHGGKVRTTK